MGDRDMTDSIVSFTSPPVVEVVAGVALEGLAADTGAVLGAFWKDRLRQQFPSLQQQPPYSPRSEEFPPAIGNVALNLVTGVPVPRFWAQSSDGQEILQLHPGWFACNWRKVQPNDQYHRWGSRREAFQRYFSELSGYLVEDGSGEPKIRQCEVTYINHIFPSATWSRHTEFSKIFELPLKRDLPYSLEQISFQAQFTLADDDEPYGRLYINILPAFAPNGKTPLYVFELTARGAPQGDGTEGALLFLDRGRQAIDRTFLSLTTGRMHQDWGREK
jgi:uncharacterized protein (TIGR04255 family)